MIGDINDSYDDSRTSEKEKEISKRVEEAIPPELLLTLRLRSIFLVRHGYTQCCCWKFSSCLLSKIKCQATYLYSANELAGIESERHE